MLKDGRACEQMTEENVTRFSNFLKIKTPPPARRGIKIDGIKRALYLYQLFAAFYMLWTERQANGGGILGDEPGLGKVSRHINRF